MRYAVLDLLVALGHGSVLLSTMASQSGAQPTRRHRNSELTVTPIVAGTLKDFSTGKHKWGQVLALRHKLQNGAGRKKEGQADGAGATADLCRHRAAGKPECGERGREPEPAGSEPAGAGAGAPAGFE